MKTNLVTEKGSEKKSAQISKATWNCSAHFCACTWLSECAWFLRAYVRICAQIMISACISVCMNLFVLKFQIAFPLIQSFDFKGCCWRPVPAHPRYTDWHNNRIVEFTSSRAFVWYAVQYRMLSSHNSLCAYFISSSYACKKTATA